MRAARGGAGVLTTFETYPKLVLSGQGLACVRGGREVFRDLSFKVSSGAALLLTGPNGSGKSTLLRLLAGLLEKAAGDITLEGADDERPLADYLLYAGHLDAVKGGLSAEENLHFWAALYGAPLRHGDHDHVIRALEAMDLGHLADLPADVLSAGQKRRLGLARLCLIRRPIWLLDEPTVSLDAENMGRLAALMEAHLEMGGMIIAATHTELGLRKASRFDLREGASS